MSRFPKGRDAADLLKRVKSSPAAFKMGWREPLT